MNDQSTYDTIPDKVADPILNYDLPQLRAIARAARRIAINASLNEDGETTVSAESVEALKEALGE